MFLGKSAYFFQRYGDLSYLDYYFESQFYPGSGASATNVYNRGGLFQQIINSDSDYGGSRSKTEVATSLPSTPLFTATSDTVHPSGQFPAGPTFTSEGPISILDLFNQFHPMAVAPSSPDRLSRLLPASTSGDSVMIGSAFTVPQLAIASRLQEYKDLLGAGGSRYSDWLESFFASRIEHVERPKLLFSASQTVNAQIIMSTVAGGGPSVGISSFLGQQGGSIAFNTQLGRSQSYYFREPGYLIDILSIRPVYYWRNIKPDYLRYQGADYFNPLYNDVGYQDVPLSRFSNGNNSYTISTADLTIYREPCFNEFRSSYDEVLGSLSSYPAPALGTPKNLYSYWVQQRSLGFSYVGSAGANYYPALFVDMAQVNSPFLSDVEDNFFINMSYSVQKKNLINKTFATRLSNR